ncbi:MAG: peptidyl-prolyl cis-trans isomerase [Candidatus Binatia bacterium]
MSQINKSRSGVALLVVGALAGVAMAAVDLASYGSGASLPEGVVARVNHVDIGLGEYQKLLDSLVSNRRGPLTDSDRGYVLERMLEEELLVQRGVELGYLRFNSTVRGALVEAVAGSVLAESATDVTDEGDLRRFFEENSWFFAVPTRLRVRTMYFAAADDPGGAKTRAGRAREALISGTDFEVVKKQLADPNIAEVPEALLSPKTLREYAGPTLLERALRLAEGEVSQAVETAGGVYLVQVVAREDPIEPDFEQLRDEVEQELRRRKEDQVFRDYLEWLKQRADIRRVDTGKSGPLESKIAG